MMSFKKLDKNFKALSSDRGLKTIINIKEPEKQVEESVEMKKHSKTMMNSNETLNGRQHVHTLNMFHQNIVLRGEDFRAAASEVALPSLKSDEKLQHVLKINISKAPSKSANAKCLLRKNISTMSVNQDQSLCSGAIKPFDGNLSDDQKLVLSVSDGTSKCTNKNKSEMKLLNANVKGILLSGKCSPYDDHLDSGTCSDAEVVSFAPSSESPQPPPVPPKGVKSNRPKQHALSDSFCSDASSSSSSDSVQLTHLGNHLVSPDLIRSINDHRKTGLLPSSLLIDIRNHPVTFSVNQDQDHNQDEEDKLSGDEDQEEGRYSGFECNDSSDSINEKLMTNFHEEFLKFHMSEHLSYDMDNSKVMIHDESDESFAGIKDLQSGTSTIRSSKGTIRGVKNRVRNGIATFLQMQQTTVKNYKEKDGGKIVLYTTSMGIIRSTYAKCQTVKKILNTLMVKFEERDVFMSHVHQQEIRDRMQMDVIDVPQLFVDGQYIGNADQVERFNEMGELRKMLKTFKCIDSLRTCRICGGYNMLPCSSCGGSKKSIHRNHFTSEFIALKCMNCDEVGLVRCYNCS